MVRRGYWSWARAAARRWTWLPAANALAYDCFPDDYGAYRLIRELGPARIAAVRLLDAETGRWRSANVSAGAIVGDDFPIGRLAVVLIELINPVTNWIPGG